MRWSVSIGLTVCSSECHIVTTSKEAGGNAASSMAAVTSATPSATPGVTGASKPAAKPPIEPFASAAPAAWMFPRAWNARPASRILR